MPTTKASIHHFWRDPALPFIESRYATGSPACYAPHTHPTLSIGAIDSGHIVMSHGAEQIALTSGSVIVIAPHQVHACNAAPGERWSYQMLYLDWPWVQAVAAEIGLPTHLSLPPALHDAPTYQAYCRLNTLLFSPAANADKEAAVIDFLGDLLSRGQPLAATATDAPVDLGPVKALLRERCEEAWPLAALADLASLSRYQLIRAFRADTGLTPHAWLLDLRINRAKELLRAGQPLAEVAHRLHFADQSHFQRVFKERVASTPKAYRQAGALFFKT